MQHRIISLPDPGVPGEAPVNTQLSFKPFLDYVRMRLQDRDSIKKEIYKLILEKFAQYPELEAEVKLEDTGKYIELLNLLYMVLSTVVEDEKEVLWGISVPVTPKIFYGSNALYQLLTDAQTHEVKPELIQDDPEMETQKCELLYSFLLEKFYHFNFHKTKNLVCRCRGQLSRFHSPSFNPFNHRNAVRFIKIFLQTGGHDLLATFQPIKIDMKQRQTSAGIFVEQRERW